MEGLELEPICSFCSTSSGSATDLRLKKKKKNGQQQLSEDAAISFCSAFNLPAEQLVPHLTDRSKATFCTPCFQLLQEFHKTAKEIEALQIHLGLIKEQFEANFREKIGRIDGVGNLGKKFISNVDDMIFNIIIRYLPQLQTVKVEVDELELEPKPFNDMDTSDDDHTLDVFSHEDFGNNDEQPHFSHPKGKEDKILPPAVLGEGRRRRALKVDKNFSRRAKRLASTNALKKMNSILQMGEGALEEEEDQKVGTKNLNQTNHSSTATSSKSSSISLVPEATKINNEEALLAVTREGRPKKKSRASSPDDEDYSANDNDSVQPERKRNRREVVDFSRMTPSIIAEKKRILKLIADHPTWSLDRIRRGGGYKFRSWAYKRRWETQIEEFEKKVQVANAATTICERCSSGFTTMQALRGHLLQLHPPRSQFICPICEFHSRSQEDLSTHTALHESSTREGGEGELSCVQCDKTFTDVKELKIHTWNHEFGKFKCGKSACDKVYPGEDMFKGHNCRQPPKKIICELCGKGFVHCGKLKRHMLSHSEEKTFQCQFCSTAVKHEFSLDLHMKMYHPDKPRGRRAMAVAAEAAQQQLEEAQPKQDLILNEHQTVVEQQTE